MSARRRPVLFPPTLEPISYPTHDLSHVRRFHSRLPGYQPTPLKSLFGIASELGDRAVLVKDESDRFGLPAFKILGASWGGFRAVCSTLELDPLTTDFGTAAAAARDRGLVFFTASGGNHGRAIATIAKWMGVTAQIFVSRTVYPTTVAIIESEGARVIVTEGTYDFAITQAHEAAKAAGSKGLFVQDASFEGYHDIPSWIVEGYSTLMDEAEEQFAAQDLGDEYIVMTPVGVGSLAHAVVQHCRRVAGRRVVAVEPDTAPSLYKSIKEGKIQSVLTGNTIMGGLNCGTPSLGPFEELRRGIDACVTVSDWEAHHLISRLVHEEVNSGPCGASTLAAVQMLIESKTRPHWFHADAVIVILNTEGPRTYDVPLDVTTDDPSRLTQILTRITSASTRLSASTGSSVTAIAQYVSAWLEHRDLETYWPEAKPERSSIIGVLQGSGSGRSRVLSGHIDKGAPHSNSSAMDLLNGEDLENLEGARIKDGACFSMEAEIAAAMATMAGLTKSVRSGSQHVKGDIIVAAGEALEVFSKEIENVPATG